MSEFDSSDEELADGGAYGSLNVHDSDHSDSASEDAYQQEDVVDLCTFEDYCSQLLDNDRGVPPISVEAELFAD